MGALNPIVSRGTRAAQPIAYTYDTLNRLIAKTPPVPWPVVSYTYDLAGRVTSVSDTSAALQPIATPGSTTAYTTSATYDALNRPEAVAQAELRGQIRYFWRNDRLKDVMSGPTR
jgi:YD repeat-containing protein